MADRILVLEDGRIVIIAVQGGVKSEFNAGLGLRTELKPYVQLKVVVKGSPRGVNCLPLALQLKLASSVSKLHATRNHR